MIERTIPRERIRKRSSTEDSTRRSWCGKDLKRSFFGTWRAEENVGLSRRRRCRAREMRRSDEGRMQGFVVEPVLDEPK